MLNPKSVEVDSFFTCRYCGDKNLAWVTTKAGKKTVVRAHKEPDGRLLANLMEPHRCPVLKAKP